MKRMVYVFKYDRLVGIQDVTELGVDRIDAIIHALGAIGRYGEVSDKGRSICTLCHRDLGEIEIEAGRISHGYCQACTE